MLSDDVENKIEILEKEIQSLTSSLASKKIELSNLRKLKIETSINNSETLTNDEISRFSRQLILPEIGVSGQIKLKNANVLIVGAGGLGKIKIYFFFFF